MVRNKLMERLMRLLITLLGAGLGVAIAAFIAPALQRFYPAVMNFWLAQVILYTILILLSALLFFFLSNALIKRTMQITGAITRRLSRMPMQQIMFLSAGLLTGLMIAALLTQLILSLGASLLTISFSALVYLVLGSLGMQIGYRRYRDGKKLFGSMRRRMNGHLEEDALLDGEDIFLSDDDDAAEEASYVPKKILDTSVIIDGRIVDIAKTGFLEGDIVVPQFVLAELRHIADSGDAMRRARGRRGLDVLTKLQKELKRSIVIDDTEYSDVEEVDVKLLRLCRDKKGIVVTNDYNLNKVAGVSGIAVLNINDLANAVKPMLMAGEELPVQIVREG